MCLFPKINNNRNGIAYKKGVTEFNCGQCPECLQKKSRLWALRCCAESYNNVGCMVTLTYDNFVRDDKGNIIGETDPDTRELSKRDCQLFIKRLRRYFDYHVNKKISYLLTAERGKRTGRSHYHAILFGVDFKDKVFYKKSKRGNRIYTSHTLTKLWNNGICTIDAVNISGKIARYCTKYCAKDQRGTDDTFMLMSRNIGDKWLLDNFNGKSYIIDGMEYSIPRQIWNKVISNTYKNNYIYNRYTTTYRYVSLKDCVKKFGEELGYMYFDFYNKARSRFRNFRDGNRLYKAYVEYWQKKAELFEKYRSKPMQRILALPNDKYFGYKQACLSYFSDIFNKLPPSGISQKSVIKFYEERMHLHLPEKPLVIKGQVTQKKFFKRVYVSQYTNELIYLREI